MGFEWHAPGQVEDNDIRRFMVLGIEKQAMDEEKKNIAWANVLDAFALPLPEVEEGEEHPPAPTRFISDHLTFEIGPRMREYLNTRDGFEYEDAWFRAGMCSAKKGATSLLS